MDYNIYLDESGNTGNIELNEDLVWNFGKQPYFSLGSFYMKKSVDEIIRNDITQILQKYDPKLGIENELKSRAKYKFKNEMMKEITELLLKNDVGFYFDIANKKYKVIVNMVEYCVYPYFVDEKNMYARVDKVNAANYLYKTLENQYIKIYIDLCQKDNEEKKIEQYLFFLEGLKKHFDIYKKKNNPVEGVIEIVRNYKQYGMKEEHLFPIKDFNNKGVKESFLPNVDAYNNIITSISILRLNKNDNISVFHDEQKQFSNVLETWTNYMLMRGLNINELKFCVSEQDILIQIADFYTGSISRLYRKIVEFVPINKDDRELIKILKPLLNNCNIVAPDYEQKEFFSKCQLKMRNTDIPNLNL